MLRVLTLSFLTAFALTFVGCSDEEKEPLVIPSAYDGANFQTNAATELALAQQLLDLRNQAFSGRNGSTVSGATLNSHYTLGNPSLKSITTTYYNGKLEGETGYLNELAKASGNSYSLGATNTEGGVLGAYLFDENGLELEQMIEKGLFGAAFYNQAVTLLSGTLDISTPDKVMALFGTNPTFPNSNAVKHPSPDRFMAAYAARRDKNDGNGFYTTLRDSFIKLQAAIKAGNEYKEDQQNAIKSIKENWEKVNASTVVHYLTDVISKLSATNPDDAQKAAALHSYSECVAFLHGWRNIPQAHKTITDGQIDELLGLLNAPADGTPTSYKFATEPVTELPKLQQVIDRIKSIYGFTDAQMADFIMNWVSVQGR